jgi:hypothetical protein
MGRRIKLAQLKPTACLFLGFASAIGAIVLFSIGGVFYSREHTKLLHYVNSMCHVDSGTINYYQCQLRYVVYTCYGSVWRVHYGQISPTFATIEEGTHWDSYAEAIASLNRYQVSSARFRETDDDEQLSHSMSCSSICIVRVERNTWRIVALL